MSSSTAFGSSKPRARRRQPSGRAAHRWEPDSKLEVRRITDATDFEEFADNEYVQKEAGWREQRRKIGELLSRAEIEAKSEYAAPGDAALAELAAL